MFRTALRSTRVIRSACFAGEGGAILCAMKRETADRLAANVKHIREAHGISLRRAAESSAGLVSPSTWARIEDPGSLAESKLGRNKLIGVAYALGLDCEIVFGWAGMDYTRLPSDPVPEWDTGDPDDEEDTADSPTGAPAAASGAPTRQEIVDQLTKLAREQQELLRRLEEAD